MAHASRALVILIHFPSEGFVKLRHELLYWSAKTLSVEAMCGLVLHSGVPVVHKNQHFPLLACSLLAKVDRGSASFLYLEVNRRSSLLH